MGVFETLKKYKWMIPLINKADRETKSILMKNFRKKKENFYPKGEFKANIDDLIKCMLCPNMCRFDCGTLQASQTETMSPAFKSRIGYYISIGIIDPYTVEFKLNQTVASFLTSIIMPIGPNSQCHRKLP